MDWLLSDCSSVDSFIAGSMLVSYTCEIGRLVRLGLLFADESDFKIFFYQQMISLLWD